MYSLVESTVFSPIFLAWIDIIYSERNRLHAKKSRDRKREFNQCLHESVTALKEENEYLLSLLNQHSQRNGEPPVQPPKQEDGVEFIIASLQNPANRVLSDESLADLQSLFQC